MSRSHELLGVPTNADRETIERAYQQRVAEYALEKVPDDPELRTLAHQRRTALERAYTELTAAGQVEVVKGKQPFFTGMEILWTLGGVLVALVLLGGLWYVTSSEEPLPPLVSVNRPAPDVALTTMDGQTVRLSDFRGKVVLVNFWATWCAPCVEEIPDLSAAHRDLASEGLVVIGINLRYSEASDEVVQEFIQRYNLPYTIILDRDKAAEQAFQLYPIPVSYFIDGDGTIRYIRNGMIDVNEITRTFRELQHNHTSAPPAQ